MGGHRARQYVRELLFDCRRFDRENVRLQVVQHDDVCASAGGSERVGRAAALHFDLHAEAAQSAGGGDCRRDASRCSNVVVL
jgi:hypothetical protein